MLFIPETPPKTTHLQKHALSIQNSIGGAEFRTLGPVASIRLKQKILGAPAAVGWRIQDPVVKNSWLFAQRTVRSLSMARRPVGCVALPVGSPSSATIGDPSEGPHGNPSWGASVMASVTQLLVILSIDGPLCNCLRVRPNTQQTSMFIGVV